MTGTNQKLREALQAISHIDDTTNHSADASDALDHIGQIARQALALPTADHIPDTKKMIATKAVPVGEPEVFEREMMDKYGWQHEDFKLDDFGYADGQTDTAWMAWQARAALGAGDAADAQRWKTSELISRTALTPPKHRTETESIAFNAYRKAMESGQSYAACVDAAIDAAMRKAKP